MQVESEERDFTYMAEHYNVMKKHFKNVIFILLLQFVSILASCAPENIIGTYCCGLQESETSICLALFSDRKCAMYGQKKPLVYGTYEEMPDSSGQYVIQIDNEQYSAEYKQKQIVIIDEGLEWIFEKIGDSPGIINYQ